MKRSVQILLILSIVILNIIFIGNNGSFLALYYVFWVLGIGSLFWKYRVYIENFLREIKLGEFKKFYLLGVVAICIEETFAGISMHLATADSFGDILIGVRQFISFNLMALSGFVIGWYLLLKTFVYDRKEIFVLAGLFGLFAEKIYVHIFSIPIMGLLLILPTVFTYALIIAPSVVGHRGGGRAKYFSTKQVCVRFLSPGLSVDPVYPYFGVFKNTSS